MKRAVVVDYGVGNLRSMEKAAQRASADVGGWLCEASGDADKVKAADAVILPGVGAMAGCWEGLEKREGLEGGLEEARRRGVKILGVCVGFQLMADEGEEGGRVRGLGWIPGRVRRLGEQRLGEQKALGVGSLEEGLRLPHMGWNEISACKEHDLTRGLEGMDMYFANGYVFREDAASDALLRCSYGGEWTAAAARDNCAGVQFHPEKSQEAGRVFLANFLRWEP